MAIRTQLSVFLGVVVNPKTHQPIYVVKRNGTWRTVELFAAARDGSGAYEVVGEGYLNDDSEWAGPTQLTGLPRSHTPSGVKIKGGGFGTALYTGLVLLASSDAELLYDIGGPRSVVGRGHGICSDDNGRSAQASAWWSSALDRDLTEQEEGEVESDEPEEETEEDVDILEMVGRIDQRKLNDLITGFINERSDDGYVTAVTRLEGTVVKTVESQSSGSVTADIYRLASAKKHDLIALWHVVEGQWRTNAFDTWLGNDEDPDFVDKYVLLALDVSKEDDKMAGKLAEAAFNAGATAAQVDAMLLSNKYGVDPQPTPSIGRQFERARILEPEGLGTEQPDLEEWASYSAAQRQAFEAMAGRPTETIRHNPPRRRANPSAITAAEKKLLDQRDKYVAELRSAFGWDELADLD